MHSLNLYSIVAVTVASVAPAAINPLRARKTSDKRLRLKAIMTPENGPRFAVTRNAKERTRSTQAMCGDTSAEPHVGAVLPT
mmetsp:Transcript_17565/g.48190  ORF Transcript_17565/g.48190 Transcript_17565/m.48190 type:complete len:82 (+) Transcript_17565:1110-1355(+)